MKKQFQFPLKQHIGEQAASTIVKGDNIVRGQLLASKGENSLGANIYSSVSGVVAEVDEEKIVILADEKQPDSYVPLKSETPLELIEEAGIVGLGGAGFPTYAKLAKPFQEGGIAAGYVPYGRGKSHYPGGVRPGIIGEQPSHGSPGNRHQCRNRMQSAGSS